MPTRSHLSHTHVVLDASCFRGRQHQMHELVEASKQLTMTNRVHLITAERERAKLSSMVGLPGDNQIVEPSVIGGCSAIVYAGYELFRLDPNAIMVYVNHYATRAILRANFDRIATVANRPGTLVSFGEEESSPSSIYAWSIYALMETYRNHRPIDFQIINEIARTQHREPARTAELYLKLRGKDVESDLLRHVQPGFSTVNVRLSGTTESKFPAHAEISETPIPGTPEDVC